MKRFYLDKKAYHTLENSLKVNVSESGYIVAINDSRIRYCIYLDQKINKWVYSKYFRKRNEFGEFSLKKSFARCEVYAAFDQVSKFNR